MWDKITVNLEQEQAHLACDDCGWWPYNDEICYVKDQEDGSREVLCYDCYSKVKLT